MRSIGIKYLLSCLLAVLLWVPAHSYAAVFFDTDFETCAVGTHNDFPCEGWDDRGKEYNAAPRHNGIAITNVSAFSGSKMVNTIFVDDGSIAGPTNCGIDNPSIYKSQTSGTHMFARFALKRGTPWTASVNGVTKLVRWRSNAGNGGEYPTISVWMQNLQYIIAIEGGWSMGTVNYQGGGPVSTTAFDQVEVEFKYNTPGQSDGLVRLWVNDVLKIERLNLQLIGPTPTSVNGQGLLNPSTGRFIETQIFVQCGIGNMYWDRFAVGNTRIGPIGAVPNPDTTPPQPPTNLTGNAASSTLTWTAGTDLGGSGYAGVQVFRCTRNPGDCTPTTFHATVNAPATSYVDTSAQAGFTYDYRVRAFDGVGLFSTYTAEVSLTIPTTNRRVLFTDTFNRADSADIGSAYDAGYTTGNPFKISSGKLAPSVASARNFETYNVAVPNDQFASILLSDGVSVNDNAYVLLRHSAPATWNGYECGVLDTTSGRLQRLDAGVGNVLALTTISPALAVGDRIRGEAQGTTLRCYIVRTNAQGVQSEELYASASDATYSGGRIGLRIAPAALPSIRVSEFLGGDFTGVVDSAITHDSTSTSGLANTSASHSWTHTVGSGDNRVLTVCTQIRNSNTALTTTSVTANGVSLTKFQEDTRSSGTNRFYTSLWRQIAPAVGANNIVATFSGAPTSHYGLGSSSSFFGVEQVTPIDAIGGANGTGTAVSLPLTTTVTGTLAVDCALGLDDFTSAGGSQTVRRNSITTVGADGVGSSTKSLAAAGAATTSWTQASSTDWVGSVLALKPAQVNNLQRPKILSGTVTPTGATGLTYGATTPIALRVIHGPNSGIPPPQSVDVPIASVPGGVLSRTWTAGDEFAQIFAIDAFGGANGTNLEYLAQSLIGIAPPANINAVVMTNPQPSTELPAGTTSALISMTIDQPQLDRECRAHTADVPYASMPTTYQMTISGTVAAVAFPVSNGNSYTIYRTCVVTDGGGTVLAESPTRSSSTFTVANTTVDTTPPGNVTNLVCQPTGTQADCTHSAATDAVSYEAYLSSDGGVTYALAKTYTGVSFSLSHLISNQTYSVKVLARDVVGNPSAADSNIMTFLTPIITDTVPPSNMEGMTVTAYQRSVVVRHLPGSDSMGAVTSVIEYCSGAACTPGESAQTAGVSPIFITNLTPGTVYRFQGHFVDSSGNASAKTAVVEVTTPTTGLDAPRMDVQFGAVRPNVTRQASGTRIPRP